MNAEMHTANIRRVSGDAKGRFIVSASFDKTIRVFDANNGNLIRTIRPPIGSGNEGLLYAVAISPDGNTIAGGGWTGWEWNNAHSVYFYDRETGKQTGRIGGMNSVINHLTYSRDGRFLVACLGGSDGIRVYNTLDNSLVKSDYYGGVTYGADFDNSGRLVTVSYDRYLRLYDSSFNLINKAYCNNIQYPVNTSISPDGELIAVSDDRNPRIEIFSGRSLAYLYSPEIYGYRYGIYSVRWSDNGKTLYAGGATYKVDGGSNYILKWDAQGKGRMQEIAAGNDSIQYLERVKNKIIFCASDPVIGVLSGDRISYAKYPVANSFRFKTNRIKISYDGTSVHFGYEYDLGDPASFSPLRLKLEKGIPSSSEGMVLPREQFSNSYGNYLWKHYYNPVVNGVNLYIENNEVSRSMAISADENNILLGADWYVRYFSRSGGLIWSMPVQGVAWDVNLSPDGRFAVAATGDGTIRWFRVRDGRELLSFFPHRNRKSWVVWSPKGFYAASPGSDSMIGWHINQGENREGLFFPAFVFSQYLNRPDVIREIISTCETDEVIVQRKGLEYPDIVTLMPSLLEMIKNTGEEIRSEKKAEGMLVGKVYSVNRQSGEVIVASARAADFMRLFDKVYVQSDEEKVYLKVNFPMMTTARCGITGDRKRLKMVNPGMKVYK